MFDAEVAEIDEFIAGFKALDSYLPPWGQAHGREWGVRWGILDALEIQRGELHLIVDAKLEKPSVVALYERRMIYRLDLVPAGETKPNPFGALALGLPFQVRGSHNHPWPENREFVRVNGFGELPFRNPVEVPGLDIATALAITARDLNITLRGDQRDVRLPAQPALFGGGV